MSTQLQLRRDTTANIGAITPAQGEPIYDVSRKALVLGDGATAGGLCATPFAGTWTPQLEFGGTIVAGTTASGVWTQIGNLVFFYYSIQLTAKNGSGGATIAGLPVVATAQGGFASVGFWSAMATTPAFNCYVGANSSSMALGKTGGTAQAPVLDTDFGTSSLIQGFGWYIAAQPTG
jgi:hypothetical protein